MPIRFIRLFIEKILFHSPMTKVIHISEKRNKESFILSIVLFQISIFDSNDRLLKDSDRLRSLKHSCSSSPLFHIPLRFTLMNTVTSLTNCSCLSSSIEHNSSSSSSPSIIQRENIEEILSTCSLAQQTTSYSSCLFSPLISNRFPSHLEVSTHLSSTPFVNKGDREELTIDQILAEFGEICPPIPKRSRFDTCEQDTDEF